MVKESVRTFGQQYLNGERSMDIMLAPPWGTAWLFDVGQLPDEEIEEQVAWELQQRLEAPLEEHIYAWHPVDDRVYAVVIRPEMLEFWDQIFKDADLTIHSISLRTGLVDPQIESGADLLPLYHLWAQGHGGGSKDEGAPVPQRPAPAGSMPPPPPAADDIDDYMLEGEVGDDRVDPLEYAEEDEEEAEEALGAILGRSGGRARRRRGPGGLITFLVVLILLASGWVMRARIAAMLPKEGPAGEVVQRVEHYARAGLRRGAKLFAKIRNRGASEEAQQERTPAVEPSKQPTPVEEEPLAQREETPQDQQTFAEQELETQPVQEERTEQPARIAESEQRPGGEVRRTPEPRGARIPVATVPRQTIPLPPVIPSAGLAMSSFYSLARDTGVDLESVVLQGDAVRMEVGGPSEDIAYFTERVGSTPAGGVATRQEPVLLAQGTLLDLDTPPSEEQYLTTQQFNELAAQQGISEIGRGVWRADGRNLESLFREMDMRKVRPFRLSVHHISGNTYHLVMLP